ncbi:MAG: prepilin-type N-terminal cleavage/methylation domain-containing protein [Gemmatales bacterium]
MIRFPEARPRRGFTLTEVLMAMFVMAIGMISLLALFPAAFQQAKWALDNEQIARAAANAQSSTEIPHMTVATVGGMSMMSSGTAQSVRNDDLYRPETNNASLMWRSLVPLTGPALGGRTMFLIDTGTGLGAGTWTFSTDLAANVPAGTRVKFPPVFVDPPTAISFFEPTSRIPYHVGVDNATNNLTYIPFGTRAAGGTGRLTVGIPRSSMSQYGVDPGFALRMQTELSMGDEINFDTNGQPLQVAGQFSRQRRFTWGYMCTWSDYKNPELCEVSAVVYNSRPVFPGTFPTGETTYGSNIPVSSAAGIDGNGKVFVKGLTQAAIALTSAQPSTLKVGDWILDSTLILPDYDPAFPTEKLPFLDTFVAATVPFTSGAGTHNLHFGLAGGQFYKVLDISEVRKEPFAGAYYQTITLDRPAKSDGFTATVMTGISDVITKSMGKMPQR